MLNPSCFSEPIHYQVPGMYQVRRRWGKLVPRVCFGASSELTTVSGAGIEALAKLPKDIKLIPLLSSCRVPVSNSNLDYPSVGYQDRSRAEKIHVRPVLWPRVFCSGTWGTSINVIQNLPKC